MFKKLKPTNTVFDQKKLTPKRDTVYYAAMQDRK